MTQHSESSRRSPRSRGRPFRRASAVGLAAGAALFASAYLVAAATAPSLGGAQSFAVLGGETVTNTGPTTIVGNLGVSPGSAITGETSITLTGTAHKADATALQAKNDLTTAYNALAAEQCTETTPGPAVELGGRTVTPGVYCFTTSVQLTGTLTLNGAGVYIFKTASTLTTATGSRVVLIGGADPCNVFWQVGSSADLFPNSTFAGSILALTSITLETGASVSGRALARNGSVTMDTNTVSIATCAGAPVATAAPTAAPTASVAPSVSAAPTLPPTSTDGAPPQGGSPLLLVALVASFVGGLALALGYQTSRGRAR